MNELTTMDWVGIAGFIVGVIGLYIAVAGHRHRQKETKREAARTEPRVQATINGTMYEHGWSSVQLHIVAASNSSTDFCYDNWRIERAHLLRPKKAVLARAVNDDYATGEFFPEQLVRSLNGKAIGQPQRFALEFFIRFPGDEAEATFKVIYAHINGGGTQTVFVSARRPGF